jgi:Ser-tRNA(Ala) deacylase AlaX
MLITKVLQNISNQVAMNFKEPYMICMKEFTESKIEPIYKFLDEISDSKSVDEFIIQNKTFTRMNSSTGGSLTASKISAMMKKQRKQSIRDGNVEGSIEIPEEMKLRCFHTLHKVFNAVYEKNAFKVPEVSVFNLFKQESRFQRDFTRLS